MRGFLGIQDRSGAEFVGFVFVVVVVWGAKFFRCITALMLQISAQHRQWRVSLGCPGRSFLNSQVIVETVALKEQSVSWTWASSTTATLRSRWRRTKGTVVMENSSVDVDPTAIEAEKLLVDSREVKRSSGFNTKINKASKWVVAAIAAVVVLWRRDEHTLWFAVGSILCGGLAKCLKYLINENRPPTADGVKGDPGMPSSHAQGFSYLAAYACLACLMEELQNPETLAHFPDTPIHPQTEYPNVAPRNIARVDEEMDAAFGSLFGPNKESTNEWNKLLLVLSWQGINIWTSLSSLGIIVSFAYLSWLRVAEGLHTLPQVFVGSTLGSTVAALWLYVWKTGVGAAVDSSTSAKVFLYVSFLASCVLCYFISFKDWQLGEY